MRFKFLALTGLLLSSMVSHRSVATSMPKSEILINFAGAGGDQFHRTATFRVPEEDPFTSKLSVGEIRPYDSHLSTMIEITLAEWCSRPNFKGVYYNYESQKDQRFFGQLYLSCKFVRSVEKKFGLAANKSVVIQRRGNPQTIEVQSLAINGNNLSAFQKLADSIPRKCIAHLDLCPVKSPKKK